MPDAHVSETQMDNIRVSQKELTQLPSILGESDIIRSFSVSGGVSQLEGVQGINVRGGSQAQNLILLDNAPVFNPSHLLGFFSIFPSDVISSAELFKSSAPIKYGGRLSSVLDIETRSALVDSLEGNFSVGLLSSRFMCAVPVSSQSGLRVAVRSSYLDFIVMPIVSDFLRNGDYVQSHFDFSDFVVRYDHRINEQNVLSFTYYNGGDEFALHNKISNLQNNVNWGNQIMSLQWKYVAKNKKIHSFTLSHSAYDFSFDAIQDFFELSVSTGISHSLISYNCAVSKQKITYSYGLQSSYSSYNSGTISAKINNEPTSEIKPLINQSVDFVGFSSLHYTVSPRFSIEGGVRIVPYAQIGPQTEYFYNQDYSIQDSTVYQSREIMYSHIGIEPRMQVKYMLSSTSSVKASVVRSVQHLHMVSMLSAALPADIWMPASYETPAQTGLHGSIGYYQNLYSNMYQISSALYGKTMQNVVEFKDGFISLNTARSFSEKIAVGKGFSAGFELSAAKVSGKFQGSISYTFSRTLRKFDEINNGFLFPAAYDKPHDVSTQISYAFSKKLSISSLFVMSSGKVFSEPISRYFIGKNLINEYGPINNSRMPVYHRLDIGLEYLLFSTLRHQGRIEVSVYNVYNRENSYYVYHDILGDVDSFSIQMNRNFVGLFPILPSCSFKMKF